MCDVILWCLYLFYAGVAITLTAASSVFFAELFWTPGSMLQAEDRVHRIGQLSPVHITYFLGRGTVDEVLWPLLQKKMKTLGELFEGERNVELVSELEGGDHDGGEGCDGDGDDEDYTHTGRSSSSSGDLSGGEAGTGTGAGARRVDGRVGDLVEAISLEEEQKLYRREAEGGAEDEGDEEVDSRGTDASNSNSKMNLPCVGPGGTVAGEGKVSSLSSREDQDQDHDREQDIFEYDGLAQAMLCAPTAAARDGGGGGGGGGDHRAYVLIEEEEEVGKEGLRLRPLQPLHHRRPHTCSPSAEIVDLVDVDDDDEGGVMVPVRRKRRRKGGSEEKQQTYICIDLEGNDDNEDHKKDVGYAEGEGTVLKRHSSPHNLLLPPPHVEVEEVGDTADGVVVMVMEEGSAAQRKIARPPSPLSPLRMQHPAPATASHASWMQSSAESPLSFLLPSASPPSLTSAAASPSSSSLTSAAASSLPPPPPSTSSSSLPVVATSSLVTRDLPEKVATAMAVAGSVKRRRACSEDSSPSQEQKQEQGQGCVGAQHEQFPVFLEPVVPLMGMDMEMDMERGEEGMEMQVVSPVDVTTGRSRGAAEEEDCDLINKLIMQSSASAVAGVTKP